jgi:hypothetical protein
MASKSETIRQPQSSAQPSTPKKVYRSLEDFDREFFPKSAGASVSSNPNNAMVDRRLLRKALSELRDTPRKRKG